jgi:hypothetical protein
VDETMRAIFTESTRVELYATDEEGYAVGTEFNAYVTLTSLHLWLVHMQMLERGIP